MDIGNSIALFFSFCIAFYVVSIVAWFFLLTKPSTVLPGFFPSVAVSVITRGYSYLFLFISLAFVIAGTAVLIAFIVWAILIMIAKAVKKIWLIGGALSKFFIMLSNITPLGELEQSGLFHLIEDLINIPLISDTVASTIIPLSSSIGAYFKHSLIFHFKTSNPEIAYSLQTIDTDLDENAIEKDQHDKYCLKKMKQDLIEEIDEEEKSMEENKNDERSSETISQNLKKCIVGRKLNISPNMTTAEIVNTKMLNQLNELQCQFESYGYYMTNSL
jgi:hypothetical protein